MITIIILFILVALAVLGWHLFIKADEDLDKNYWKYLREDKLDSKMFEHFMYFLMGTLYTGASAIFVLLSLCF